MGEENIVDSDSDFSAVDEQSQSLQVMSDEEEVCVQTQTSS